MVNKLSGMARILVPMALVAVMLLSSVPVSATQQQATRFYGIVTLDGVNVPLPNTTVTAWIEGTSIKTVTPIKWVDGITHYALDLLIDDPNTPEKDGGAPGDVVKFKITLPDGTIINSPISSSWQGSYVNVKFALILNTPEFEPGDANQDGVIDMGDVTAVQMMIMGLLPETDTADANGDGVVDMGDVTRIMMIVLGLYP